MKAFEINVTGIVQGVAFRHFTKIEGDRLGLSGTVQNYSDGSVQIWVEGEDEPMMQFIQWCQHGPDSATVEALQYKEAEPKDFKSFTILR